MNNEQTKDNNNKRMENIKSLHSMLSTNEPKSEGFKIYKTGFKTDKKVDKFLTIKGKTYELITSSGKIK